MLSIFDEDVVFPFFLLTVTCFFANCKSRDA
jgi:hypothetical protein